MRRDLNSKINFVFGGPSHPQRPIVCFIPGGPGLSSRTLTGIEILKRSFDLAFVDPPGTGGLDEVEKPTFEEVVSSLIKKLAALRRQIVLVGHSFGGYYTTRCLADPHLEIVGLVFLCAPITPEAYAVCCRQYDEYKSRNSALAAADANFATRCTLVMFLLNSGGFWWI